MDKLEYYYCFKKGVCKGKRLIAIDSEWSKNWRSPEKFKPFLITVHSIYIDKLENMEIIDIDLLDMETEIFFRGDNSTTQNYLISIDNILGKYIDSNTTIVGHQLSSDLHTMKQCSNKNLPNVSYIIECMKNRKTPDLGYPIVFDTRYDIKKRIPGEEKLRTVSLRMGIFAVQTELDKMSLTKMYNTYEENHLKKYREMLIVMNWRHAFQTCLVCLVDMFSSKMLYNSELNGSFLLTNSIIKNMGMQAIDYLSSREFNETTTKEALIQYIEKYYPRCLTYLSNINGEK